MRDWKNELIKMVTLVGGESPIESIDDENKVIQVKSEADGLTVRRIEEAVRQMGIEYEVRQLA